MISRELNFAMNLSSLGLQFGSSFYSSPPYMRENTTAIEEETVEALMLVLSMYRFPILLNTDVLACPFFKAN